MSNEKKIVRFKLKPRSGREPRVSMNCAYPYVYLDATSVLSVCAVLIDYSSSDEVYCTSIMLPGSEYRVEESMEEVLKILDWTAANEKDPATNL